MYGVSGTTLALATGFVVGGVTLAEATSPETRINNVVSVAYEVGSVGQAAALAEAGFVVDRKIDVQVINTNDIPTGLPNQSNQLIYKVVNEGNDAQPFDIDVTPVLESTGGLDFGGGMTLNPGGPSSISEGEYRVYLSADATFDSGTDTPYDPTGISPAQTLQASDDNATTDEIYVIIDMILPENSKNKDKMRFSVAATALNRVDDANPTNTALIEVTGRGLDRVGNAANSTAVDIIFADAAGTANSAGSDGNEDGQHTDNALVTIVSAELTVAKTVVILNDLLNHPTFDCTTDPDSDPADTEKGAIPGACLEYTITVENGAGAGASATDVAITDIVQTGISFEAFKLQTNWDATGYDDTTDPAQPTITASISTLAPGESSILSYRVTID